MNKLLTVSQMREADLDCLNVRSISSVDLMEKASKAFIGVFEGLVPEKNLPILILCGTGNNGGDGLSIARLLQSRGYASIRALVVPIGKKESSDFLVNLQRLKSTPVRIEYFDEVADVSISENIIIDAILGSGKNRPLDGKLKKLIDLINCMQKAVIAVDCPTGFRCEGELNMDETVLKACDVVSFQRPKLNFFFPESSKYMERFHVVDIGLREEFIDSLPSDFYMVSARDISKIYRKRQSFSHKGTYGHALIYTGYQGKSGAALLCAEACVYAGAGLTSVCLPIEDRVALYSRLPEAMVFDDSPTQPGDEETWKVFSSIAIGPGSKDSQYVTEIILALTSSKERLVLDAEALNILARDRDLMKVIEFKKNVVLTPHMKEFDRLFGESTSWLARLQLAIEKAKKHQCTIVLKNRYTFIVLQDGKVLINPTGNPAMASGGMGDVLTGIITSFLAQGYDAEEACVLACYLHGKAGDLLVSAGNAVVPASQLIAKLPYVIGELNS